MVDAREANQGSGMNRGEFNAKSDGMTRIICTSSSFARLVAAGADDLLRNATTQQLKAHHVRPSRQSLSRPLDRTRWHREVSGRCWDPHGCAASVGANRDRLRRRGPAGRVSPHIVDLKVCVVVLRRPWPNHIVVVLHTGHGHKSNPLNPSTRHSRSGR